MTERRVQQLTKNYRDAEEVPALNPNSRSRTHLSDEQKAIIDKHREKT
ncbi:MAG: hypothetical protein ACNYVW_03800 [Methanosarcinales archaeon]